MPILQKVLILACCSALIRWIVSLEKHLCFLKAHCNKIWLEPHTKKITFQEQPTAVLLQEQNIWHRATSQKEVQKQTKISPFSTPIGKKYLCFMQHLLSSLFCIKFPPSELLTSQLSDYLDLGLLSCLIYATSSTNGWKTTFVFSCLTLSRL